LVANLARQHSFKKNSGLTMEKRRERISVVALVVIISDGGGSRFVVHWLAFNEF